MSASEKFVAFWTRGRQPTECACSGCRGMCQTAPCLGTPEDILRLIEAGFAAHLSRTTWAAVEGAPVIEMVQLEGVEVQPDHSMTCCMFDAATGDCRLHARGLKPTEGVLAFHQPTPIQTSPTLAVALSWTLPENRALVSKLFGLIQ